MNFDLAAMIRQQRKPRRQSITLRPIIPSATRAGDLYAAAYQPIVAAWQSAVKRIEAAYARAVPTNDGKLLTDAVFDLDAIIATIESELSRLVIAITPRLREWTVRAEQAHRTQWARNILTATGIDASSLMGSQDVGDTVGAFISRNVSLIRSVSDDTRTKVSDIVLRGYQARTPLRQVAKEMDEAVDLGRKRALRIASDQNAKLSAGLDQARQAQAGISQFAWHHSYKKHPRPWHQRRDGKVYDWSTLHQVDGSDQIQPGDNAGQPPFCGCRTRGVISLD